MKYLIYISTSVKLMTDAELTDLLKESRDNNTKLGITGMLIYSGGTFMQVLEGSNATVNEIYRKIENDPRHKNIIKLTDGDLVERQFPDWAMGFMAVDAGTFKKMEGYIKPSDTDFLNTGSAHASILMLKTFIESNRTTG